MKKLFKFEAFDRTQEEGLWNFRFKVFASDETQAYWRARKILERNFKHYGHMNARLMIVDVQNLKSEEELMSEFKYADSNITFPLKSQYGLTGGGKSNISYLLCDELNKQNEKGE